MVKGIYKKLAVFILAWVLLAAGSVAAADWSCGLTVANNGKNKATLTLGTAANATDKIDAKLGEVELPPLPPPSGFDARFQVSGTNGVWTDMRPAGGELTWVLQIQAGAGGHPVRLDWSSKGLPPGSLHLQDVATGGKLVHVDMRKERHASITQAAITQVQIVYKAQGN